MTRIRTISGGIVSAGYDALCAILELEFLSDGKVVQYLDVPEDIWYQWKRCSMNEEFYYRNISGKYALRQGC